MLVNFLVSSQEAVEKENWELRSMLMTSLHYVSGERNERNFLEVELTMENWWAVLAQESLSWL